MMKLAYYKNASLEYDPARLAPDQAFLSLKTYVVNSDRRAAGLSLLQPFEVVDLLPDEHLLSRENIRRRYVVCAPA